MIVDNIYYSLTVEEGKQYLTNKVAGLASLLIEVFLYTDTSKTNAILSETLDDGEKYEIVLTTDARYTVVITHALGEDEYEYPYYSFLQDKFLAYIQSFLCTCEPSISLSGCAGCENYEDMDAFSFLTYLLPHLYLFTDQTIMTNFQVYMHEGLKEHESFLKTTYTDMFWAKDLEGAYTYNIRTLQIYYSLIYVYFYEMELLIDSDSDYVDTKYKVEEMRTCIEKLGLFWDRIVNVFAEKAVYGKIYYDDLSSVVAPCTEIAGLTLNNTLLKADMEVGIEIILPSINDIIIVIPKVWGVLTEIQDAGGANLITDFALSECGNYYLYDLDYPLSAGTYTFKIII